MPHPMIANPHPHGDQYARKCIVAMKFKELQKKCTYIIKLTVYNIVPDCELLVNHNDTLVTLDRPVEKCRKDSVSNWAIC